MLYRICLSCSDFLSSPMTSSDGDLEGFNFVYFYGPSGETLALTQFKGKAKADTGKGEPTKRKQPEENETEQGETEAAMPIHDAFLGRPPKQWND